MKQIFLSEKELAERWRIKPQTLNMWRHKGKGPDYIKIEGKILYKIETIESIEKGIDTKTDKE